MCEFISKKYIVGTSVDIYIRLLKAALLFFLSLQLFLFFIFFCSCALLVRPTVKLIYAPVFYFWKTIFTRQTSIVVWKYAVTPVTLVVPFISLRKNKRKAEGSAGAKGGCCPARSSHFEKKLYEREGDLLYVARADGGGSTFSHDFLTNGSILGVKLVITQKSAHGAQMQAN